MSLPVNWVLDHSGIGNGFVTGSLSVLQLARAQVLIHDPGAARKSYDDFLTLGKNADPDIPVYRQAKAEYSELRTSPKRSGCNYANSVVFAKFASAAEGRSAKIQGPRA
jgi:hypothetical protein